jgi:small subunit ribosomal protein S16
MLAAQSRLSLGMHGSSLTFCEIFSKGKLMAVRIRLKKLGRRHRPFFRICAMDQRSPRDGRVIEELGTYDPMVTETDARVTLNAERVQYWLGVGAKPTHKTGVLIRKYGKDGTHLKQQEAALARLKALREAPVVIEAFKPKPKKEKPAEAEAAAPAAAAESVEATAEDATAEATPAEAVSTDAAPTETTDQ